MKRALILGGTGFIGQHLAEALQRNCHVSIYGRTKTNDRFPFIEGNFSEETNFERLLADGSVDVVYHLVSTTVPKEDTEDIAQEVNDNVLPTLRLLETMRKTVTPRLIFVSSGGTVYGEASGAAHTVDDCCKPICGYGMQKLVIEEYLAFYRRRYGLNCRVARLSNPYGLPSKKPRGQGIIPIFLEKLAKGEPIMLYGDTVRDYIHIEDAVAALVSISEYTGEAHCLNIGSGNPVRLTELVYMMEEITGKHFSRIEQKPIRACDVMENVLDISETVCELNWQPQISLAVGIERTWKSLLARL